VARDVEIQLSQTTQARQAFNVTEILAIRCKLIAAISPTRNAPCSFSPVPVTLTRSARGFAPSRGLAQCRTAINGAANAGRSSTGAGISGATISGWSGARLMLDLIAIKIYDE